MTPDLDVLPEVAGALTRGAPVVALESTVIAHGLPWPENLAMGRRLEAVVRESGAVPATVAVLGGRLRVGLGLDELEHLAQGGLPKLSQRDLSWAVARGGDGATTVSATMHIAHLAGIRVFATGGIGGVHRGDRWDVSADLPELARTPVIVVCAGAKAILDLPATLEWLETHAVPVLGYGTDEFPAFFTRSTGLPLEARVDSPAEAAAVAQASWRNRLVTGVLVCAPCPPEVALPRERAEPAIEAALAEASTRGVAGKAITPFLLARVAELTGGESRTANQALLERNARLAAEIAVALG